jgi:hypothetical protein
MTDPNGQQRRNVQVGDIVLYVSDGTSGPVGTYRARVTRVEGPEVVDLSVLWEQGPVEPNRHFRDETSST